MTSLLLLECKNLKAYLKDWGSDQNNWVWIGKLYDYILIIQKQWYLF